MHTSSQHALASENMDDLIELKIWDSVTSKHGKRVLMGFLAVLAVGAATSAAIFGARVWRVDATAQALQAAGATYAWRYQTFDSSEFERPDRFQQRLAGWIGNAAASDLTLVKIQDGDLDDEQLAFLSNLDEVRSLELQSHRATDLTLDVISKLPNLRYLTLVGKNFSIMGLLQLRNMESLQMLRFDPSHLSAIELALLKSELPGVVVASTTTVQTTPYEVVRGFSPAV